MSKGTIVMDSKQDHLVDDAISSTVDSRCHPILAQDMSDQERLNRLWDQLLRPTGPRHLATDGN